MSRRWVLVLCALGTACHDPQLAPPMPPVTMSVAPPRAPHVVRGKVTGADGRPVAFGHARLLDLRENVEVELAPDGTFTLALPDRRLVTLEITALDHRRETLLLATGAAALDVDVRLGTYKPVPLPESAAVDVMRGRERVTRAPMKRQANGKLVAEITADDGDYQYEISGVVEDGGVVPRGPHYEYDGNGDYLAPLHVANRHAAVIYDLAQRPPYSDAKVRVGNDHSVESAIAALGAELRKTKHSPAGVDEARKPFLALLQDPEPLVRQVATVGYFGVWAPREATADERAIAKRFVAEVPPEDAAWSVVQGGAAGVLRAAGDPAATAALIDKNKDDALVAELLLAELSRAKDDIPRARRLVARLKESRFDHTPAQGLAGWSDPDRSIAPGKKMPAFELPAIAGDHLKGTVSTKRFGDGTYLVELWATWCAPCVGALPKLHEVFADYGHRKDEHLEILSVSLDDGPATVARFRADKAHPMPWNHAYLEHGEAFYKDTLGFEKGGVGVPFYILVNRGLIIAASPDLEPEQLPALLDRLLGHGDR